MGGLCRSSTNIPDFHLEDKVNLETESNERHLIILQYSKRGKRNVVNIGLENSERVVT